MKKDEFDEAEFEAFLEGKGKLAQHLRDMPHPEPSPELDAAIFAAVERDLAHGHARDAANDAAIPEAASHSAFKRWQMPLATAATIAFVALLVRQFPEQPAPASYPAAAEFEPKAATEQLASAAKSAPIEMREKGRARVADKAAVSGPVNVDSVKQAEPAKRPESNVLAEAVSVERKEPPAAGPAPASSAQPEVRGMFSQKLMRSESADTLPAPAAPAPPVAEGAPQADVRAKLPAPAAAAPARDSFIGMASKSAMYDYAQSTPEAWLSHIESLLKQPASEPQALREWERFRKEYPEYKVPEALEKKLKALQK